MQDDFFRARPPRSTDGPHMIRLFESALERSTREVEPHVTPEKILATACAAASTAIVHALLFLPQNVDEVIVSGGGIHNRCLMKALETHFSIADIAHTSTDALNLPSQSKEALAFALLGAATLDGRPGNLPSVTGAARPVVLGSVTPRP
jgi:anhydro-N-acetylmuramic acid kinase